MAHGAMSTNKAPTCTKEHPAPVNDRWRYNHIDAVATDVDGDEYSYEVRCPNCGFYEIYDK